MKLTFVATPVVLALAVAFTAWVVVAVAVVVEVVVEVVEDASVVVGLSRGMISTSAQFLLVVIFAVMKKIRMSQPNTKSIFN